MNNNSKIIVYDDSCPLCAAYTNAFIKTGIINKEGRKNFSNITPELMDRIDLARSANEIPLIDIHSNQVWYGIDALLELLGPKIPFIKWAGHIQPIKWLLYKTYKLISYNRRVIVATQQTSGSYDCRPDFNMRYRFIFLLICQGFITLMLFPVQQYLLTAGLATTTQAQLLWANVATLSLNASIAFYLGKNKGMEYLGQINMLVVFAVLLMIPLITFNKYLPTGRTTVNSFFLGMLVALVIYDYFRRMKFANILQHYPLIVFFNFLSIVVFIGYLIF